MIFLQSLHRYNCDMEEFMWKMNVVRTVTRVRIDMGNTRNDGWESRMIIFIITIIIIIIHRYVLFLKIINS